MDKPISILITGVGFVAGHIIDALQARHPDWNLSVFDVKSSDSWRDSGIPYFQADITNLDETVEAFEKARPTIVIHTAGWVPGQGARYARRDLGTVTKINVDGTRNALQAAKATGVKAFVFTSSCCIVTDDMKHEYPNMDESLPTGLATLIYGYSKGLAEPYVLAANGEEMLTCAIRPSVILGPHSRLGPGDYQLVPQIHACIAKYETPFIIGSGENLYDFTFVTNVADAHVLAIENLLSTKTAAGEAFFISNQEPVPFRDFMLAIWREFDHVPPFEVRIPESLAWLAGLIAEWATWITGMSSMATLSRGSVQDATGTRYASGDKARRILGYYPRIGLQEGIRISCLVGYT
ncbi:NAD(P)-binding protein [Viridothelium virens]|uniref:NAD(P)-binding protein n=1 Tax=Viridothelium virens TaxID=1048519 RepID=A0A6A6HMH7_VIRVR|nr:NAD(P)-binding protein [Viridothelium virens]